MRVLLNSVAFENESFENWMHIAQQKQTTQNDWLD